MLTWRPEARPSPIGWANIATVAETHPATNTIANGG
jgi:hypothetical protein